MPVTGAQRRSHLRCRKAPHAGEGAERSHCHAEAHATTGEGLLGIVQFAGGNRLPLGGFEIAIDADHRQPDGTAVGTTLADFNLDVEVSATSFSGAGAFALPPPRGGGAGRPSAWT